MATCFLPEMPLPLEIRLLLSPPLLSCLFAGQDLQALAPVHRRIKISRTGIIIFGSPDDTIASRQTSG